MSETIDWTKPVQTRSGIPVRILCRDAKRTAPIVGLKTMPSGKETLDTWYSNGRCYNELRDDNDLVNVKEKVKILIYKRDDDSVGVCRDDDFVGERVRGVWAILQTMEIEY